MDGIVPFNDHHCGVDIMWKVEIEEYNRLAQDLFPAEREYFRTKKEALDFIYTIKKSNCNCSIWLTKMVKDQDYPDDWIDTDDSVCFQDICYY